MSSLLEKTIELYDEYASGNESVKNELIMVTCDYIRPGLNLLLKKYNDSDLVDEVISEVTIFLLDGGIEKYTPGEASFAVFVSVVAKRRGIDKIRKLIKDNNRLSELKLFADEEDDSFNESILEDKSFWGNPEKEYISNVIKKEIYDSSRTLIDLFLNDDGKPYMTIGAGYSIVLYNYKSATSKVLASPQWAYNKLENNTVFEGGDNFIDCLQKALKEPSLHWGDDFIDQLEDEDRDTGKYIGELNFGENFQKKDFENWTARYKTKMVKKMVTENPKVIDLF